MPSLNKSQAVSKTYVELLGIFLLPSFESEGRTLSSVAAHFVHHQSCVLLTSDTYVERAYSRILHVDVYLR